MGVYNLTTIIRYYLQRLGIEMRQEVIYINSNKIKMKMKTYLQGAFFLVLNNVKRDFSFGLIKILFYY